MASLVRMTEYPFLLVLEDWLAHGDMVAIDKKGAYIMCSKCREAFVCDLVLRANLN